MFCSNPGARDILLKAPTVSYHTSSATRISTFLRLWPAARCWSWGMPSFPLLMLSRGQSQPQQETAGRIRYPGAGLTKGLIRAAGWGRKVKRNNVLVRAGHNGANGQKGYKKRREKNYAQQRFKWSCDFWPWDAMNQTVDRGGGNKPPHHILLPLSPLCP